MAHVSLTGTKTADWVEQEGWYRGEVCHAFPTKSQLRGPGGLEQFVLAGWMPERPLVTRDMAVTAIGSCFAHHVEDYLARRGYRVGANLYAGPGGSAGNADENSWGQSLLVRCSEAFVNTFSLRYQFEWIYEGTVPRLRLWKRSEARIQEYIDDNRDAAEAILRQSDVFIITLGLSEVWYDKRSGEVLWSSVPNRLFDPDVYGFRVTSVAENLENLEAVYRLIRAHRGPVPIVLTLSPVPLAATFRPVSCVTANSVSKAILRVAVDDLLRAHAGDDRLFYFPAYEIITEYFADAYAADHRHVDAPAVGAVMAAFERHFCVPEAEDAQPAREPLLPGEVEGGWAVRRLEAEGHEWLRRGHRLEEACQAFRAALEADPDSRAARLGLAIAQRGARRLAESRDLLRALLAERPDDSEVLAHLGMTWYLLGRLTEAFGCLCRAHAFASGNVYAWSNLERLVVRHAGRGEAVEAVTRLIVEHGESPSRLALLRAAVGSDGPALDVDGRPPEARAALSRALEGGPIEGRG